jgi:cadmium resistance protein CadD (predicted permease)
MRPLFVFLAPALLAVPLFVVTNADDLVLLTIFFSNPRTRARTIVTGQLAGIAALTIASILVARLALELPENWLPLLGLAPIALGVRQFISSDDDGEEKLPPALGWMTVASVTIANGGDNLGVYIPVFANETMLSIAIICAMFGVLTLAWCGLARQIVRHPRWGDKVQQAANAAAPYVLIGVGLWVLARHPWVQSVMGI